MAIGKKIVSLRKKYNFTQEKLAERIGVSRQTLSSWESDITSPDLQQASRMVKIFKISLDELVDNQVEISCKDNSKDSFFQNLIGKNCYLTLSDDFFDWNLDDSTLVKVVSIHEDFMKVEYKKRKEKYRKLIDMDFVISIKVVEEDQ